MTERRPRTEAELVALMRAIDVRAPDSLHRRVEQLVAHRARARRYALLDRVLGVVTRALSPPPRFAATAAVAAAALALGVVLSVGGTRSSGPSLRETAALTLLPATASAPARSHTGHAELVAAVDGVRFPYLEDGLGWRSTGRRSDRVGGRSITTVFYSSRTGARVGYAIVSGLPAPSVRGGVITRLHGVAYRLTREGGAMVVTWLRAGHLCVISGRGVSGATLERLASWGPDGSVRA
jgi:hypothetical protein